MSPQERSILETLDILLRSEIVRAGIDPIVNRVAGKLLDDAAASMAWEPIPLPHYGASLPPFIPAERINVITSRKTDRVSSERPKENLIDGRNQA